MCARAASGASRSAFPGKPSSGDALILVVDDEPTLRQLLQNELEDEGYTVLTAANGDEALRIADQRLVDLVVLDVGLPGLDGYQVVERLRQMSSVPVIMLTARIDMRDKIKGLDLGADDYITKPFGIEELRARVAAVLRRGGEWNRRHAPAIIHTGAVTIDFARRRVVRGSQEVSLSPKEYKLLQYLAINAGRVVSHQDLLHRVWGPQYHQEVEYLWVYVRHLRRKLEENPQSPRLIISHPGVGYSFQMPD